jgi:hypothetical protein
MGSKMAKAKGAKDDSKQPQKNNAAAAAEDAEDVEGKTKIFE